MDKISQLDLYASNGFNMKDGTFLGKPVFNLTFENANKNTIMWDGQEKIYPDQISADTGTSHYSSQETLVLENESDYDRAFSASINAEYAGAVYSGSVKSSFMYHGNLFQSSSETYGLDFYVQTLLQFKRLTFTKADLDADFIAALAALPVSIEKDEGRMKYNDFFDMYGTHYISGGSIGGTIIMETSVSDSLFKSTEEMEVKAAISAGYQGVVASGKLDADAAYKASSFLQKHQKSMRVSLTVMGGTYAKDASIVDWIKSVYATPIILLSVPSQTPTLGSTLLCLSRLPAIAEIANAAAISKNITAMVKRYTANADSKDGIISTGRGINLNEVTELKNGAGFVLATIKATNNGDRGYILGYAEVSIDPKAMRAAASQHFYTGSDVWAPSASLLMPVANGATYKMTGIATSGKPSMNATFIGIGDSDVSTLGNYVQISPNTSIIAPQDGFVLAYIYAGNNGDRGDIHFNINGKNYAGSSAHNYNGSDHIVQYNSFMIPVKNGATYKVQSTPTCGRPTVEAFFVPIQQADAVLGDYQSLDANHTYMASTDGFLIGYLDANGNGNRGEVTISCYPAPGQPGALLLETATSVHDYHESDSWLTFQTATLPVPKGFQFGSNLNATCGNPKLNLFWIPLSNTRRSSITAISTSHNTVL